MPYETKWVDPQLVVDHNGVQVYHVYCDDDISEGVRPGWFTTDPKDQNADESDLSFDVRTLSTFEAPEKEARLRVPSEATKLAIRRSIDKGELTSEGVVRSTAFLSPISPF